MKRSALHFVLLLNFLQSSHGSSINTLYELKEKLVNNALRNWLYKDFYGSLPELGIHYPAVNRSVHCPRQLTHRIKNLFYRAINGENITVAVLGGSISAGATLYKDRNEDKIFFYALKEFWNSVVQPITGSRMLLRNIAIGAIGSDFYSYCLENYVDGNETDLIIWELSANDYHRFDNRDVPPTLPLELLTRSILRLEKQPGLIYAHFFRGKDYKKELECNNLESDGANYLSKYYKIPSVSWRQLVCRRLVSSEKNSFNRLFARDDSHPSLLGHAQMAYLLIHLFRKMFLNVIDDIIITTTRDTFSNAMDLNLLEITAEPVPKPVFIKTQLVAEDPICFTFDVPSNGQMPYNRKKILRVIRNDGYVISTAHGFLVRKDKTEGLRANVKNMELHLEIHVPNHVESSLQDWMILIGSYSNFGSAVFFLDNKYSRIIETEKYAYGSIVAAVATHVKPGKHDLVIKSLGTGFFLSSIMLG